MATAIDFQALLREERAKALAALQNEDNECCGSSMAKQFTQATNEATTEKQKQEVTWQSLPDPPIQLKARSPLDLNQYSVGSEILKGIYYIPDFVTPEEASQIIDSVYKMPNNCWTNLRRRRLQNHGGTPHPEGMLPERIPRFLSCVLDTLVQAGIFPPDEPPNHILLNEYTQGQGIMPHKDGPLYEPIVAILSLDGPALLQFWDSLQATKSGEAVASVLCLPNSLLIFSQDAYHTHWHGIRETDADTIRPHTINHAALAAAEPSSSAAAAGASSAPNDAPRSSSSREEDAGRADGGGGGQSASAKGPSRDSDSGGPGRGVRGGVGCVGGVGGRVYGEGCVVQRGDRRVSLTMRRVSKLRDAEARVATAEAAEEERRRTRWWLMSRGEEGFKLT